MFYLKRAFPKLKNKDLDYHQSYENVIWKVLYNESCFLQSGTKYLLQRDCSRISKRHILFLNA